MKNMGHLFIYSSILVDDSDTCMYFVIINMLQLRSKYFTMNILRNTILNHILNENC